MVLRLHFSAAMNNTAEASTHLVHIARSAAERESIYRLRYQVYIAEQGKTYSADHDRGTLRDDSDASAEHLYIREEGRAIAAVRMHLGGNPPNPAFPLGVFAREDRSHYAYVSRLVVERSLRGGVITPLLFRTVYRFAVEQGVKVAFTWCIPALVTLYKRVGFREFEKPFADPTVGELVPLVFITDDVAYLRAIRSSLAPLAALFNADVAA